MTSARRHQTQLFEHRGQHCTAVPELVVDGRAQLSIVRHAPGCPTLLAQVRTRWPDGCAGEGNPLSVSLPLIDLEQLGKGRKSGCAPGDRDSIC